MKKRSTADWYHLLCRRREASQDTLSDFLRKELLGLAFSPGHWEDSMEVLVKDSHRSGKAVLLYVDVKAPHALYACAVVLAVCSWYAGSASEGGKLGVLFAAENAEEELWSLNFDYLLGLSFSGKIQIPESVGTPYLLNDAMSELSFDIKGLTAHGSAPHLGINSLDAAALAVTAAQMAAGCPGEGYQVFPAFMDTGKGAINMIPDHTCLILRVTGRKEQLGKYTEAVKEAVKQAVLAVGASIRSLQDQQVMPAGKCQSGRAFRVLLHYMEKYYGREHVVSSGYCMGTDAFHRYQVKHRCDAAYLGRPILSGNELKICRELSTGTNVMTNTVQWLLKEVEEDV
ncbi:MAG: hypothetical protein ACOYBE_11955 [Blautia sp.]|jgi:hypothetical protein